MKRPSIERLPAELARAARIVAEALRSRGTRAWIVGGAVRDLVLDVVPKDVDVASAARPDEVEALFPTSHAVGKAFGTVVVRAGELDVQVTTFRRESGYADARRPDSVAYADTPEEDARRRDFTCNALYLDPLDDELLDPTGGLADLEARLLRCVGDAHARFAEDGLRILRLARLAARFDLAVEPGTRAGARAALDALRGVSPERVLAELSLMAAGPAPARALALLHELGALARLPGLERSGDVLDSRVASLDRLEDCDEARLLALLLLPRSEAADEGKDALEALRPSRALRRRVTDAWRLRSELRARLAELDAEAPPRSLWVPLVRSDAFADALALDAALEPTDGSAARERLRHRASTAPRAELFPAPLLTGTDLERAGVPGPRRAEVLRTAEARQLDGELRDRAQALAWLARTARAP